MKVLVTDAELTLTLAAVRSLARAGFEVIAASPNARAHAFRSRAVHLRLPSPTPRDPELFAEFVGETTRRRGIAAVLPIGAASTAALAQHRDHLPADVGIAVPAWPSMQIALSKSRTARAAANIGISIPRAYARGERPDRLPLVAKPDSGSGAVRYVNELRELDDLDASWLVQEYVGGEGRGVFALFDNGEPRAVFAHRRVRELPVTGGASTAAESVDDPQLVELGLRLLREFRWHGVAMVEFKRAERDGAYVLMEVNPKFWGSLSLAIACGVDFPVLAVSLALGREILWPEYRAGCRFQWIVQDVLHAAARPSNAPAVARDLVNPRVRKDFSLRDPLPTLAEARSALRRRHERYPHGRPGR